MNKKEVILDRAILRSRTSATLPLLARRDLHSGFELTLECSTFTAASVTFFWHTSMLDGAADLTDPAARDHAYDISAADNAYHSIASHYRYALEAITGKELRHFIH